MAVLREMCRRWVSEPANNWYPGASLVLVVTMAGLVGGWQGEAREALNTKGTIVQRSPRLVGGGRGF